MQSGEQFGGSGLLRWAGGWVCNGPHKTFALQVESISSSWQAVGHAGWSLSIEKLQWSQLLQQYLLADATSLSSTVQYCRVPATGSEWVSLGIVWGPVPALVLLCLQTSNTLCVCISLAALGLYSVTHAVHTEH
jgi:hypothetical protein